MLYDDLKPIDLNKKISAEQHVYLYYYKKMFDPTLVYDDVVFKEHWINNYNRYLQNSEHKHQFMRFLQSNKDDIDNFIRRFKKTPWKYAKPMIWDDGGKTNYYIENLTLSHRFEVYIAELFKRRNIDIGLFYSKEHQYREGENKLGIEIKRDIMSLKTRNLYIEYKERRRANGPWVESGILKSDNTNYFLIGDFDEFYILKKRTLLDIYHDMQTNQGKNYPAVRLKQARRGTSLGFIIPIRLAKKWSLSIDHVVEELMNEGNHCENKNK